MRSHCPGGSTDTTARVVAQGITAGLGQPVVVVNRTSAAGNVATEHVARSAPDSHTLVVASMGSHATNAALYRPRSRRGAAPGAGGDDPHGECPAASPSEPARPAAPIRRLRNRLLRGTLLRRTGRLLEEAEGGRRRGQKAELASAAGPLHALCARDAWDARERRGAAAGVRR